MITLKDVEWMRERGIVGGEELHQYISNVLYALQDGVKIISERELVNGIDILYRCEKGININLESNERELEEEDTIIARLPMIDIQEESRLLGRIEGLEVIVDRLAKGYPIRITYIDGIKDTISCGYHSKKGRELDIDIDVPEEVEEFRGYPIVEVRGVLVDRGKNILDIVEEIRENDIDLTFVADRLLGAKCYSIEEEYKKLEEYGFKIGEYRIATADDSIIEEVAEELHSSYSVRGIRIRVNDVREYESMGISKGYYMAEQIIYKEKEIDTKIKSWELCRVKDSVCIKVEVENEEIGSLIVKDISYVLEVGERVRIRVSENKKEIID